MLAPQGSPVSIDNGEYETVAASQTAQVLGGAGAGGDSIRRLIIRPANLNAGAVTLIDGVTSIVIFPGGTGSVTELKPITVELGMRSLNGPWKITTGADVSVIAIGRFT